MIVRGFWKNGRAYFNAEVTLPHEHRFRLRLQVDTAASRTMISESVLPAGMLKGLGFQAQSVDTLVGKMPCIVVPGCRLCLYDGQGEYYIGDIPLYFARTIKLTPSQLKTFRRVLAPDFRERIDPPRDLLGKDVIGTNLLLAKDPSLLVLTDEAPKIFPAIEQHLDVKPEIGWVPYYR